jgi:hypothetical protein
MLEAMAPSMARAQASQIPLRRFLAFYVPNGMHMANFTPGAEGALGTLPTILSPLESVKEHITVVSGLACDAGFANGDGAGDHARGTGTFLTCARLLKSDTNIRNAISVDQVMASHLRAQGFGGFASLEVGGEGGGSSGNCDSGYSCAYSRNIAWAGPQSPLGKETNPRALFDRLFGSDQGGAEEAAAAAKRRRRQQSILDVVKGDAATLDAKLGQNDRRKLDEYMTGVRELERRLDSEPVLSCTIPGAPSASTANPTAYIRALLDTIVTAVACDRARVVTFMLGNGGSGRNYSFIGQNTAHHEASHHQGDANRHAQLTAIGRWEVEQLAYLVQRLKDVQEGAGTALDSTMVVMGSEIEDGNSHNHANLPVVVAGHAGGAVAGGRHIRVPNRTPIANLYSTALGSLGAGTSFADSTGTLALS